MKVWKLVSGILSIILSFIVGLQSCSVMMTEVVSRSDRNSGGTGFWVGVFMLAYGIVGVATSWSKSKGGSIAVLCLTFMSVFFAFSTFLTGGFSDIVIWGAWSLIVGVMATVDLCLPKKTAV